MGKYYKNLTLLGPPREALEAALLGLKRTACLTPPRNGLPVVFDLESDEIGDPAASTRAA
jgi:hypothetical protein